MPTFLLPGVLARVRGAVEFSLRLYLLALVLTFTPWSRLLASWGPSPGPGRGRGAASPRCGGGLLGRTQGRHQAQQPQ